MPGAWGGKRKGAGRPLSHWKNQRLANELLERMRQTVGKDQMPTPLEYGLGILWDEEQPQERRDKVWATLMPYMHPRLAAVAVATSEDMKPIIEIRDLRCNALPASAEPPSPTAVGAVIDAEVMETDEDQVLSCGNRIDPD